MNNTNSNVIAFVRNREEFIKKFGHKEVELAIKYLYVTDTEADVLAQYIQNDPDRKAKKLFDQALEYGIESIENPPQELNDFFRQSQEVPEWVDWSQLERGAIAITKMLLLGPLALPIALGATYVSHQSTSLVITEHLEKRAESRLVESTIFFSQVFKPGNMKPGAEGFKKANHLRLIHAFARAHIGRSPKYDVESMGAPINQYDTACGQYYYFSTLFIELGEKFGLTFSYQEKADIFALWRYICLLMGVPDELLAKTVEEASNKSDFLKATFEPNDASRALLKALVHNTPTLDTMFLEKVLPKRLVKEIVNKGQYNKLKWAVFRDVLGDEVADKMAVPKSSGHRYFVRSLSWGMSASYQLLLKNKVNKIENVMKLGAIGEKLIEEYYQITNSQAALIDNSAMS
ncbi:hypothetical protein A9Q99_00650 [Gammaproteobacteria bacterium 45_16_T64]|nr:hypothetical protein A9Q99_00650 [Gammaproteobacteria bacterium 45_16_T64]